MRTSLSFIFLIRARNFMFSCQRVKYLTFVCLESEILRPCLVCLGPCFPRAQIGTREKIAENEGQIAKLKESIVTFTALAAAAPAKQ